MILSEIWVYPIKSFAGIRLSESIVEERGLKLDRRWMVVDENGALVTQREYPKMAHLQVSIEPDGLLVVDRTDERESFFVGFQSFQDELVKVRVWDDEIAANPVGDPKIDLWLSNYLEKPVRLVRMPENGNRPADPRYAPNGENVSFADGFPFLLISEASLNDLNNRLAHPITMQRFRPNLVVKGMTPYQEDFVREIRIGGLQFGVVKPCARCVMTTIDPQTIQKGAEPLKTLATYRRQNNKILFGQNLIARNHGDIREGDNVSIIE